MREVGRTMTRRQSSRRTLVSLVAGAALALAGLVLGAAAPAQAATQTFDLYAVSGQATMPGGQSVTVLGYADSNAAVSTPGGPTLVVTAGDTVEVTLHNTLGEQSALLFQGQEMAPDLDGVAAGGQQTYSFVAGEPGTYLYEAGLLANAEHQVAMGLYGALVVRPAAAGQAYGGAATAFDDEAVLVLSEVDPALNNAPNPASFDMRSYSPRYFLINGKAYPDTDAIPTTGGNTVLLRYVNAGIQYHSMAVLGADQEMIALDGSPLADPRHYVAETIGPGQTADALVAAPATGDADQQLTVYDGSLLLHNSNVAGTGGMVTTVNVPGNPSPDDTSGPVTSAVAVNGGNVTATIDDRQRGGSNVAQAEYYLDAVDAGATAMAAVAAPFDADHEDVTAAVSIPPGEHVLYVRGRDAADNWGPFSSVLVSGADVGGPTTSSPVLTPNRVNHSSTGVDITATADDSGSGNSNVDAAEYFIDTVGADGGGAAMAVNHVAPVASLDATIPAGIVNGLPEGSHVIWIHARDAQGNWGEAINVNLVVDTTGPITSGITVDPSPNDGTQPYSDSIQAVRVSIASMTDPLSGSVNSRISAAEGFIDTVGADGSGIKVAASDGQFTDTTEGGYIDIPLATVRQMSNGTHTIYVHAKDAAGNWGATATGELVIDKAAPSALFYSTVGNSNPPGVVGTADDSDTYRWNGAGHSRVLDVSAAPYNVPAAADVDGYARVDATHFYVSFAANTTLPGLGAVQDEDVVLWNAGSWQVYFDGTSHGLTTANEDIDALSVVGSTLYFSTLGNTNPPGVGGTADNADVYSWNGTGYARVWDATANGLPAATNVDGLDWVDATHLYLSFSPSTTTVTGLGTVQDEDVVQLAAGSWSVYFDGTAHGMRANARDVDAFDIP